MRFHFFKTILDDLRAGIIENIVCQLKGKNIHSILLSTPHIIQTSRSSDDILTGLDSCGKVHIQREGFLCVTDLSDLSIEDLITLLQCIEEGRFQTWDAVLV